VAQQEYGFSKESPIGLKFTLSFFIGCIATYSGAFLSIWSIRELGRFSTLVRKEHKLVKSGPYAYVRHPTHAGYLMSFVGFLLCLFTQGSLIREWRVLWSPLVLVVVGVMLALRTIRAMYVFERAVLEDEGLRKEFGQEWEMWAETVQYRILIGIF
jgi:protein-S-isoprenylcysteine O-methyltransferase Ste14